MKLHIFKTEAAVLDSLAAYFVEAAAKAIAVSGKFSVALSGGNSPKKLYQLLASVYKDKVEWQKIDFFFGDERNVPQTDPDSNYRMAKQTLFEPLNISPERVFAVDTTQEPNKAAAAYAVAIQNYFSGKSLSFDLVLLGLGDNSHTASLFPNTPVLHEHTATVKAVFLKDQDVYRITFTAPLINNAQQVAFLVYGAGKAIAVHHVIEDARDIENFPAQLVAPSKGDLQWFMDEAAAAGLKNSHA